MAQRNPEMTGTPGTESEVLAAHLREQATEFLRSLRLHREATTDARGAEEALAAARALRRAARRLSAALHTFRPLLDAEWAAALRPELAWLSGTLAQEHAYASRLSRLLDALHRLSGPSALPGPAAPEGGTRGDKRGTAPRGLTVGAAKAAALLERQLTLARTRAHSTALQALGSSRFHAVADSVAVLASEVPLSGCADDLKPLAAQAESDLAEAVAALPLGQAGHPYNAEALTHGLAAETAPDTQDAPWLTVRSLLRLHRYAQEVLLGHVPPEPRLADASRALDLHREAAAAASAAAQAARTPRIAPATAYALGVLHADQRHEVEAARFSFQRAWQHEPVSAG